MFRNTIAIFVLLAFIAACKTDKSIYKPKRKRKGKCDCPHLSMLVDNQKLYRYYSSNSKEVSTKTVSSILLF